MRTANLPVASAAVPAQAIRLPLPILVGAFCLLWASAFSVAKLAIVDCPPLLVLAALPACGCGHTGGWRNLRAIQPQPP
jgi:hypothetical protein